MIDEVIQFSNRYLLLSLAVVGVIAYHIKVFLHFKYLTLVKNSLKGKSIADLIVEPLTLVSNFEILLPFFFRFSGQPNSVELNLEKRIIGTVKIFWITFGVTLFLAFVIFLITKSNTT